MADKPTLEKNKEQQDSKKIKSTDGKSNIQETSGFLTWVRGLDGPAIVEGIQDVATIATEIDSALTSLANLNLNASCKQVAKLNEDAPTLESFAKDLGSNYTNSLVGCNPYKDLSFETPASSLSSILTIAETLTGPPRFPSCMYETYRNILSAAPVEYLLLNFIKNLAAGLKTPVEKLVPLTKDTPCGQIDLQERLLVYENALPNVNIPLIPELPYINIPDFTDIIENIIYETICFTLCAATTPLINTLTKAAYSGLDEYSKEILGLSIAESELLYKRSSATVALNKIPIRPFLEEADLTEAKNYLISIGVPTPISDEKIIDYVEKVQGTKPTTEVVVEISQEEFVFLLLGKLPCGLYARINLIPDTVKELKLDNEVKVVNFFAIIGSLINMLALAQSSKAEICPPDPCELKPDSALGPAIQNLCRLLSPQKGVDVSTNSLLTATKTDEQLADSIESICDTFATNNKSYNPIYNPNDEETLNTSYLQKYFSAVGTAAQRFNNYVSPDSGDLAEKQEETYKEAISEQILYGVENYLNYCFPFSEVTIRGQVRQDGKKVASWKDFIKRGATIPGLAPSGQPGVANFEVYLKDNRPSILSRIRQIGSLPTVASKTSDNEKIMEEFRDLKKEYGL